MTWPLDPNQWCGLRLLGRSEPRLVLVDEALCFEVEVVGVRAQKCLRVRRRRKTVEPVVLERLQVLRSDSSVPLDVR